MATRVPALIQLSDPRVAAQLVIIMYCYLTVYAERWPIANHDVNVTWSPLTLMK